MTGMVMQFLESKGETGVTCTKVETVEELLQEADVSVRARKPLMFCSCPGWLTASVMPFPCGSPSL